MKEWYVELKAIIPEPGIQEDWELIRDHEIGEKNPFTLEEALAHLRSKTRSWDSFHYRLRHKATGEIIPADLFI